MTNLSTKILSKFRYWMRGMLSFFLAVSFLAVPITSNAATPQPQQFGPSSYLPMLRNNYCTGTLPTTNPFGIQLYGPSGRDLPYFNLLQSMRPSWIRTTLFWWEVEPVNVQPSQYDWGIADRFMQAAIDNCANIIATVSHIPGWITTGDGQSPIKTELMHEFLQFMAASVERYDGDGIDDAPGGIVVNYWEIFSEPDGAPVAGGGAWGEDAGRYADMLEAVYPVIIEANPNAKVVLGGLAYDLFTDEGGMFVREFLDNVLAAGGGEFFDIMNFHYYPFSGQQKTWTESNSSGLVEKIDAIEAKLAEYNLTKEIIITEIGWHSNSTTEGVSNQDFQARRVVELMVQAMSEGIKTIIWWPFLDTTYPFDSGLLTANHQAKFAYTVYKEAMRRVGTATNIKNVVAATVQNDLEVYESRMAGSGKLQYIAWLNPVVPDKKVELPFNDSVTQTWQAPGRIATIYAKDGTLLKSVTDSADGTIDNMITITVGRSPIYIEIN